MRRAAAFLLALVMLSVCLTGCAENKYEKQFKKPKKGDTIAILHTTMGDITVRFFPEEAPKAVNNFLELAKSGYSDGITFHRVIQDFMIQGGDPTATGRGGESSYGAAFENEIVSYLSPYYGALCMANAGVDNTNTSQFFIVTDAETNVNSARTANEEVPKEERVTEEKLKQYEKHGGAMWLDQEISTLLNKVYQRQISAHTVFGQVIDGMDVAVAISMVDTYSKEEVTEANIDEPGQQLIVENKPREDVVIESVEITTY